MTATDAPAVAVLHPVRTRQDQAAVVAAGDDHVADRCAIPIAQEHLGARRDLARVLAWVAGGVCAEPIGSRTGVQLRHDLPGRGQQHRVESGSTVGRPRLVGRVGDGTEVADVDAVVVGVVPERGGVAVADREGDRGLGGVTEAAHLGEGGRAHRDGDVAQHPAGTDRGELLVVTDQPHQTASHRDVPDGRGEVGGGGLSGLVDDHHR